MVKSDYFSGVRLIFFYDKETDSGFVVPALDVVHLLKEVSGEEAFSNENDTLRDSSLHHY